MTDFKKLLCLTMLCCLPAFAHLNTTTATIHQSTVSVHVINTMVALSTVDVVLTAAGMIVFYKANGDWLCSFGKSQAIPLVASALLLISSAVARATFNSFWISAAAAFSILQGIINPFRAYLGVWYHFFGGQSLPGMPEQHDLFFVIGQEAAPFSLTQFLSPQHHLQVAKGILETFVWQHEQRALRALTGSFFIGLPLVLMAAGITEFSIGLTSILNSGR